MQMSGGHLLAAGLDGGNTLIFAKGENVIKSRLAGTSIVLNSYKESIEIIRFRCFFLFLIMVGYIIPIYSSFRQATVTINIDIVVYP